MGRIKTAGVGMAESVASRRRFVELRGMQDGVSGLLRPMGGTSKQTRVHPAPRCPLFLSAPPQGEIHKRERLRLVEPQRARPVVVFGQEGCLLHFWG